MCIQPTQLQIGTDAVRRSAAVCLAHSVLDSVRAYRYEIGGKEAMDKLVAEWKREKGKNTDEGSE